MTSASVPRRLALRALSPLVGGVLVGCSGHAAAPSAAVPPSIPMSSAATATQPASPAASGLPDFLHDAAANADAMQAVEFVAGTAGSAYAASTITTTGGVVYVATHIEAAALKAVRAAAATESARGIAVEVQIVPLNADQLQVAIRQIANDPWWKQNGIRWASVGADPVTARVQVSLVTYSATIARDITAHYGTAVQVLAGDHPIPSLT